MQFVFIFSMNYFEKNGSDLNMSQNKRVEVLLARVSDERVDTVIKFWQLF